MHAARLRRWMRDGIGENPRTSPRSESPEQVGGSVGEGWPRLSGAVWTRRPAKSWPVRVPRRPVISSFGPLVYAESHECQSRAVAREPTDVLGHRELPVESRRDIATSRPCSGPHGDHTGASEPTRGPHGVHSAITISSARRTERPPGCRRCVPGRCVAGRDDGVVIPAVSGTGNGGVVAVSSSEPDRVVARPPTEDRV